MHRMFVRIVVLIGFVTASAVAVSDSREEQHAKLSFLVGKWDTSHEIPAPNAEATVVRGEATIDWVMGEAWLRHEFHAEFPGRGPVFMTNLMNFSVAKNMYNLYLFDHFGGDAGVFYGDWVDGKSLVFTARFDVDGETSYQKFTLTPVSDDELWFTRAFSDDGVHYHFEVKGVYKKKT